VVVGTAVDYNLLTRQCREAYIRVYKFSPDGTLEFVHKTLVEEVALALTGFQGRLLVGVGKQLRLYDIGIKKLLRKCDSVVCFVFNHHFSHIQTVS
jgi:splicing factor 3B subunit 3